MAAQWNHAREAGTNGVPRFTTVALIWEDDSAAIWEDGTEAAVHGPPPVGFTRYRYAGFTRKKLIYEIPKSSGRKPSPNVFLFKNQKQGER